MKINSYIFKWLLLCGILAGCQADPFVTTNQPQLNGNGLSGEVAINFWLSKSDSAEISVYYPNWAAKTEIQLRSAAQVSTDLFLPTAPLCYGYKDIPKIELNGVYTSLDKNLTGILYTTTSFSLGIRDASQSSQTWKSNSWNSDYSLSVGAVSLLVNGAGGKEELLALDVDGSISKSSDGLNWTTIINGGDFKSGSSYPRWDYSTVLFSDPDTGQETVWVVGGNIGSGCCGSIFALNDVQKLVNGNWVEVVAPTDPFQPTSFTPRYSHSLTVFPDVNNGNKPTLWIIGGHADDFFTANNYYNDIWKSADGKNWKKVTLSGAIFTPRKGHRVFVMVDPATNLKTLWLIGGYNGTSHLNDIWKSTNGINWTNVSTSGALFYGRSNFGETVVNDPDNNNVPTIFVIGGETDYGEYGDIWKSTDAIHWFRILNNGLLTSGGLAATIPDTSNVNQFNLFVIGAGLYKSTNGSDFKRGGSITFTF